MSSTVSIAELLAGRRVELVPRLALTLDEAAECLGISRDSFDRHVRPKLRVVREGKLIVVPVRELERYVDEHAARVFE